MRKFVSFLVALIMVICSFNLISVSASAEDGSAEVQTLISLGILVGDEAGDLNLDKEITRAEFSTIVTRILGINTLESKEIFTDVPLSYWGNSAINTCYNLGIINGHGDGTFAPEDFVTYEQAVKMIVCALGYEPMAKQYGGYPSGYLRVANQIEILENVDTAALRGDIAHLIYNALFAPKMSQTSFGTQEEFNVLDGEKFESLLTDKDIYVATGVVGERTENKVSFLITEDSEDLEFTANDVIEIKINGLNLTDYMHHNVSILVEKVRKNNYKAINILPEENEFIIINSEDIVNTKDNKIEYYLEVGSNKTKTIKISENCVMEYNKVIGDYDLKEFVNMEDVEIKCIENTGDSSYDSIVMTKYDCGRLEQINLNKNKIVFDGKTIELDFDDEDLEIILEDSDGVALTLEDFAEDDVVAVLANTGNIKDYSYLKIIRLSDATISGTITETYSENGNQYVYIDDVEYQNMSDISLELGDEGIFYIGITGKIIDFDEMSSSSSNDYGYILEAAKIDEGFSKDEWQIKMLTANGIHTYKLTDNCNKDFADYASGVLNISDKALYEDMEKTTPGRLVTFKLNSSNEIRKIELIEGSYINIDGEYNADAQVIDGVMLEDETLVFNIISDSVSKVYTTNLDYLADESKYSGFVVRDSDREVRVAVICDGKGLLSADNGFAIVSKVTKTVDADDNEVIKVTYYQNEEQYSIIFNEESTTDGDIEYDAIKVGSVFLYNGEDVVTEYLVVAQIVDNSIEIVEDIENEINDEDVVLYSGYIANTERQKNSKGELITIGSDVLCVTTNTNLYTYNNSKSRDITIETEDMFAGNADYRDENEVTSILILEVNGIVVDAYTVSERIIIE